ncbi:zinc finger protein 26-like [Topomyia yanbarensis]|uniref:zinc finger protein 26-like n=1 Tax=Topomyia yanbarensis TaxID=2498891 RepID=UPI00273ACCF8|nr:zinc finger protein 26-like [Topomyia yanbarensis]XP_058830043.1 zinc finger protein 26-like [Topomyia yanbarensis]XP_058830044.1 zinc finger protein 26-like [Topomyia yanbarensis]XP_058830045.1 zinc finger protein 26-like [Topomyia yanbarensis]XP_058830046.1 zinc finger protein 26-like [Topomyia yanbarensis]XP_058830047.1 zinc finger protein 26-like [Topomyia yanbarensis]
MTESEELQLQVNADEMCRTCLGQFTKNQLKPIFCNEILDGKIVPFPKVMETTMAIQPVKNELFPSCICVNCKSKLKELFSFKEKALNAQNLLFEIFGVQKPAPPPLCTKIEKMSLGVQTDAMQLNETDEHIYRRFLSIDKIRKPVLKDTSTQSSPIMSEMSTQISPAEKKKRHVSVQVMQPKMDVQDFGTQVDLEILATAHKIVAEYDESDYTDLDVIYESEEDLNSDDTHAKVGLVELLEDITVSKQVKEEHSFNSKPSPTRKTSNTELKLASEHDQEENEYVSYEVLDEINFEPTRKSRKRTKKSIAAKKPDHECSYCQYVTDNRIIFDEHNTIHQQSLESIFEKTNYYRCTTCKRVYATSIELETHFQSSPCAGVDQSDLVESEDIGKHEHVYSKLDICLPSTKSFHKDEKSLIICSVCKLSFKTLSDALQHHNTVHDNENDLNQEASELWKVNEYDQVHVCGVCNGQFPDASFIRQHVYFHRTRFECPFDCKERFGDFFKMTVHIGRWHLSPAAGASSSTTSNSNLLVDLVCHICFKRFNSKASYKTHTKNHFADRRYTCSMCPKAFIQKSDLVIHIRSHTDERPFACTVDGCDKRFRTTSHRRDHMSTHALEKNFQCDICQKYFKAERILQGHLRLHSGYKPFECEHCGKSFSRKHHVKLHMKTHGQA